MNGSERCAMVAWTVALVSIPATAVAYVDPGTTSAVFGGLAYILAFVGAGAAFLFRPVIRLYRKLFRKQTPETEKAEERG
ncbi:hypothetical protein GGQ74_002359 [Desulfobaculum xiamenense]|uniref:Uncharacterized protein n=1 Tax=Desulfobaculum xiamenense TaxID=995050 RepID=A0A846QIJ8_9BACT|nr:hypothetical protein [Desulfobaculum xiamenense]NJB68686.1 hypothetical protein [Desulfobaculum xiamenense]